MRRAGEIFTIFCGGEIAAITLSRVNEWLELMVLVATLTGIIWKIFKKENNENTNSH